MVKNNTKAVSIFTNDIFFYALNQTVKNQQINDYDTTMTGILSGTQSHDYSLILFAAMPCHCLNKIQSTAIPLLTTTYA